MTRLQLTTAALPARLIITRAPQPRTLWIASPSLPSFCTRPTTLLSASFLRHERKFWRIRILLSSKPKTAAIVRFSLNLMAMMAVGRNRKSWNSCESTELFLSYTITSNETARENPPDVERGDDFCPCRQRGTDFSTSPHGLRQRLRPRPSPGEDRTTR